MGVDDGDGVAEGVGDEEARLIVVEGEGDGVSAGGDGGGERGVGGVAAIDGVDGIVAFCGDVGFAAVVEGGEAVGEVGGSAVALGEFVSAEFFFCGGVVDGDAGGEVEGVGVADGIVGDVEAVGVVESDAGGEVVGACGDVVGEFEGAIVGEFEDGDAVVTALSGVDGVVAGDGEAVVEAVGAGGAGATTACETAPSMFSVESRVFNCRRTCSTRSGAPFRCFKSLRYAR